MLSHPDTTVPLPEHALRFQAMRSQCRILLPNTSGTRETVLAFSHHKAGSTMFYGMLRMLAEAVGMKFVTIPGEMFQRGIDLRQTEIETDWPNVGFCFGGFRFYPETRLPLIDTARTALLVRDPRDAIVSLYFSARDSHRVPEADGTLRRRMLAQRANAQATPIDVWVIENHGAVIEALTGYIAQGFLSRPNVVIYRYEDVIYRKRAWMEDLLGWYGWEVGSRTLDDIVTKFDVFPKRSDTAQHIRQVHPGNHKALLKRETCRKLDDCFGNLLGVLGYTVEPS